MATQSNNKDVFLNGFRKLLTEQWQSDVQLKAGDTTDEASTISAHKLVLAARSEVLKKMLEPDEIKASSKLETITLSEMKHKELEALVEFIYSVDGSISSETLTKHVRSLYLAADKYEIPYLRDLCRNNLISSLSLSNALNILELAQIPFDKVLHDAAFANIQTNLSTIASSAQFNFFVIKHPNLAVEIMKAFITRASNTRVWGYCNTVCGYCKPYYR
ncbi:putative BTB/POZ domain-containing protein [Cardamine amara subsp. amara]|uniref:BTB/POZ domain-containing protein n=1 Tax=Cardamine amara subsp. amara TaxID=228776 RepID=A0ABD0ZCL7_CARAN